MSEFGSDVSTSEVSGDSGTTSDVSEVETGTEVNESEMDEDLSHELDDSYDSYMEEGEGKSFESDFDENEEVDETELEETDEPPDDLESDLDSKYDSYIEDAHSGFFIVICECGRFGGLLPFFDKLKTESTFCPADKRCFFCKEGYRG